MKIVKILTLTLLLSLFSFVLKAQKPCLQQNTPLEPISQVEINQLKHIADEEKLAGDVYKTLFETWNLRVFDNISRAEDQHKKVVLQMIDKYDIDFIPQTVRGKYNDPKMEQLYLDLVTQGKKSIVDALKVGAMIEDLDIYDLNNALNNDVDSDDLTVVFSNIRQGSYHHIKAFTNNLKRYNEIYTPQYISQSEYNDILNN
ncbi:MAG: DUF2202 domain-containing protein [Bacteroidales bacterium]|nr:DUF2202 domain-containing protein [Bacteroidales bacterium]